MAWDHLRNDARVLRIDRIKNAELTSKRFKLRPELIANDPYEKFFAPV
ncbi:WYL domain-containing protein [Alteromonas gracilis]